MSAALFRRDKSAANEHEEETVIERLWEALYKNIYI